MTFGERLLIPIQNAIILTISIIATGTCLFGGTYGATVAADKFRGVKTGSSWNSLWKFVDNHGDTIVKGAVIAAELHTANHHA